MHDIKESMLKRDRFKYGYWDIFSFLLCWVWWRPKKNLKYNRYLRKQVNLKISY